MLFKTKRSAIRRAAAARRGGYGYTTRIPLKDIAPGHLRAEGVEAQSRLGERAAGDAPGAVHGHAAGRAAMIAMVADVVLVGCDRAVPRLGSFESSRWCSRRRPPRTVDKGEQSNIDDAQAGRRSNRRGVDDALAAALHRIGRGRRSISRSEMVVGVFLGSRPTRRATASRSSARSRRTAPCVVQYREIDAAAGHDDRAGADVPVSPRGDAEARRAR